MPRRPTPVLVAVLALVVGVTGCGSQGPPEGGSPGQNASQVPGTRPSQTVPPGFQSTPAPGAPSNSTTTTATVPADATGDTTTFAIVDQETGDFAVGLGGDHLLVLQIGIHGVGKAWNTKRATVHRLAGVTVLRYDGPGRLDARARLDGPSAMSALPVDPRPAHLRVQARMTADGLGRADVWIDGHHHQMVSMEPPHTADPVVAAVVTAFRSEDWSALYDLTVHLPGMTRAEFVGLFGRGSSVSELDVIGKTLYRVANGVAYAEAPVHLVATLGGGGGVDRDAAIQLVYRHGAWRFSSIARRVGG